MKPVAWMTENPNVVFTTNPIGEDSIPLYMTENRTWTCPKCKHKNPLRYYRCSNCKWEVA